MRLKFLLLSFLCVSVASRAITISSVKDGNWEDASTWSGNQVPGNPDSIIVKHYVIVNQNFNIYSPSVLYVQSSGTICGDFLMKTLCGAKFINYGHMYLGSIQTRDGSNYNIIQSKNYISLYGCLFATNGFSNYPPNGTVSVWPPVFCKTQETNWESGIIGLVEFESLSVKLYPNPINNKPLTILVNKKTLLKVSNALGDRILTQAFDTETEIDFSNFSKGIYFLELVSGDQRSIRKIIKSD